MEESKPFKNAIEAKKKIKDVSSELVEFRTIDNQVGLYKVVTDKDGIRFDEMPNYISAEMLNVWVANNGNMVAKFKLTIEE